MSKSVSDRNLLFGVTALQIDFISRDQLIIAMSLWASNKSKSLGQILIETHNLDSGSFELVEKLIDRQIAKHGSPEKSLEVLQSIHLVKHDLEKIQDLDIQQSIAHLSPFFAVDPKQASLASNLTQDPAKSKETEDPYRTIYPPSEKNFNADDLYKTIDAPPEKKSDADDPYKTIDIPPEKKSDADDPYKTIDTPSLKNSNADDPHKGIGTPPFALGSNYRRFQVIREHAQGRLGIVYVAIDNELNRKVALKEIKSNRADDLNNRDRFNLEAEVTGGLEHPDIVPVYGFGKYVDGRPYYAMRFIKGETFQKAIQKYHQERGTLPMDGVAFRDLLKRFIDTCNAIAYAHSRQVLHRDLKPDNIMLGKYGETLVVDWGLAKAQGSQDLYHSPDLPNHSAVSEGDEPLSVQSGGSIEKTQSGKIMGTPAYMSPEQAEGKNDQLTPASDLYSLGGILFTILTGKVPFQNDKKEHGAILEILENVRQGNLRPPRSLNSQCPNALEAICLKAMKKDPSERYATAKELAEEVEQYLADEPVKAYREPVIVRVRRWGRRHRSLVTGMSSLVITALLGLIIGIFLVNEQRERVKEEKTKTEAALTQSRERFNLALEAFQQMVFSIQEKLDKRPGTQDLKKDLLEKARQGLEKLRLEKTEVGQIDHTTIWSHFRMGDLLQVLGDTKQALQEMETGNRLANIRLEANSEDQEAQRDLSLSYERMGIVQMQINQTKQALASYQNSFLIDEKIAKADPLNQQAQRDLSVSYNKLGNVQRQMNQTKEALNNYQNALLIREKIAKADPLNQQAARDLAISYESMGDVQMQLNLTKEALVNYQNALLINEKIANADPFDQETQRDWLVSHSKLAEYYLKIGNLAESKNYFEKAIELGKSFSKPEDFQEETTEYESRLSMLNQTVRIVQNLKLIEQIADQKSRPPILIQAVNAHLFQKNWTKAAQTVDYLIEHFPIGTQVYNLSSLYSRKIPEFPNDQKQACTTQAMKILKKSIGLGYRDWQHMQKDFDLDPLRELPEFQKLLTDLEATEPELLPLPKLR